MRREYQRWHSPNLQRDMELLQFGHAGARVIVFVVPEPPETFNDLMTAAESSLAFWDNPLDDEDWNNA